MDEMNTNMDLDFRTMTAVLALGGEESLSILGAWNCMKTLAREDPEGCVRLMPGLSMDIAALTRKRERCRIRQANRRVRNIKKPPEIIQRFRFMVFIRCNGWPAW